MAREENKEQMIKRLQTERRRLENTLARLDGDDMLTPGVVGEWSIKDVLAHLADWEAHMVTWVAAARGGDPVESPGYGLAWKELDLFNQRVFEDHCQQPLDEVLAYFHAAHERFMEMVEAMPEEEMLTRGYYRFLGKDAVYNWLGAYANHDSWGKTKVQGWMKTRGAT